MSWPQRKEQPRRSPTLGNGDNSQSAFYCQSDSSTQRHYSQSTRAGSLRTWLVADRQVFTQPSPRGSPGMQGDPNPPPGTGQARLGLHCPLQHQVPSIGQFLGSFWLSWKLPREGVGDGGDQNWGNRAGAVRRRGRKNRKRAGGHHRFQWKQTPGAEAAPVPGGRQVLGCSVCPTLQQRPAASPQTRTMSSVLPSLVP